MNPYWIDSWLNLLWQQKHQASTPGKCLSDQHVQEEFVAILPHKTASAQPYSQDVWCKQLWWGHSTFFFSHSVEALLPCFGSLSCCITQLVLSFSLETANLILSSRREALINLGIYFPLEEGERSRPRGCKVAATNHDVPSTILYCLLFCVLLTLEQRC